MTCSAFKEGHHHHHHLSCPGQSAPLGLSWRSVTHCPHLSPCPITSIYTLLVHVHAAVGCVDVPLPRPGSCGQVRSSWRETSPWRCRRTGPWGCWGSCSSEDSHMSGLCQLTCNFQFLPDYQLQLCAHHPLPPTTCSAPSCPS